MKSINTRKRANRRIIAGAIFDFMGFLTSRKTISIGANEHPGDLLDAYEEWGRTRNLNGIDPYVLDWEKRI